MADAAAEDTARAPAAADGGGGGRGGGARRPFSGGLRSSSARRTRPGSAAPTVVSTTSGGGGSITDEGVTTRGPPSAASHWGDDSATTRGRGAPLPPYQRPQSSKGERILPAPSISKTGHMSELAIGTRQLAKSSAAAFQQRSPRRRSPRHGGVVPVELDELRRGLASGRAEELVSSPRVDLRLLRQEDDNTRELKAAAFQNRMGLRYAQDGTPLQPPPTDPIDAQYVKYGLRRPLSSRDRAREAEELGLEARDYEDPEAVLAELDALARGDDQPHTSRGERSGPPLAFMQRVGTSEGRSGHMPWDDGNPCVGQYRPRLNIVLKKGDDALMGGGSLGWGWAEQEQRAARPRVPPPKRPTSAPPAAAAPPPPAADSVPADAAVLQAVASAADLNATASSAMLAAAAQAAAQGTPASAPGGTPPGAAAVPPPGAAGWFSGGVAAGAAAPGRKAAAAGRGSRCFETPARPGSAAARRCGTWRPNPHFPPAGNEPQYCAADDYWPHNEAAARHGASLSMARQLPRAEAGRAGYAVTFSCGGGHAPDAVYHPQPPRGGASAAVRFTRQVPADTSQRNLEGARGSYKHQDLHPAQHVVGRALDCDPAGCLSTHKDPAQRVRDWARAPAAERGTTPAADHRKDLDVDPEPHSQWPCVARRVPSMVPYPQQTSRPELLHPNEHIQLQYDARHAATERRAAACDFSSQVPRGAGPAAGADGGSELEVRQLHELGRAAPVSPPWRAVKKRSSRAPRLDKREQWRRCAEAEVLDAAGRAGVFRGRGEDGGWWGVTVVHPADPAGGAEGRHPVAAGGPRVFTARVDGATKDGRPGGDPVQWPDLHLSDIERQVAEGRGTQTGHWRPAPQLDRVYDVQLREEEAARRRVAQKAGFDRQLTREKRDRVHRPQLSSADAFYDPAPPEIKGHVPFGKSLGRKKPPAGYFAAACGAAAEAGADAAQRRRR